MVPTGVIFAIEELSEENLRHVIMPLRSLDCTDAHIANIYPYLWESN